MNPHLWYVPVVLPVLMIGTGARLGRYWLGSLVFSVLTRMSGESKECKKKSKKERKEETKKERKKMRERRRIREDK